MPKNKKKNKGGGQHKSQGKQQEKQLNGVADEQPSSTLIGELVTSVSNFIAFSNNTATWEIDDKESAAVDPAENTCDKMSERLKTESEPKGEKIEFKHESLEEADDKEVIKADDKRAKVDPDDFKFSAELEGMSTKQKKKWKERTKKNNPNKYDRYIAYIIKRDGGESIPSPDEKVLKNPGALPYMKDQGTFRMGFNKKSNISEWGEEDGKVREVSNERGGGRDKSKEKGGARDESNERGSSARNKSNERGGGARNKSNERGRGARNKSNERGGGARNKSNELGGGATWDEGEKKMSKNQKKKQKKRNKAQSQSGPHWPLDHPLDQPETEPQFDHQPQQFDSHHGNSSSNFNSQGRWEPQPILRKDGSIVLQEVYGDLFDCPDDHCLAHCVSADMHMAKGVQVEFKKRFRGLGELFAQGQHTGGMAYLFRQNRFIYYLVTKEEYHKKPTMHTLRSSLELMHQHIMQNKVSRLAMPMIGCGLDKLDWDHVKSMLGQMFYDTPVQITVYYL